MNFAGNETFTVQGPEGGRFQNVILKVHTEKVGKCIKVDITINGERLLSKIVTQEEYDEFLKNSADWRFHDVEC